MVAKDEPGIMMNTTFTKNEDNLSLSINSSEISCENRRGFAIGCKLFGAIICSLFVGVLFGVFLFFIVSTSDAIHARWQGSGNLSLPDIFFARSAVYINESIESEYITREKRQTSCKEEEDVNIINIQEQLHTLVKQIGQVTDQLSQLKKSRAQSRSQSSQFQPQQVIVKTEDPLSAARGLAAETLHTTQQVFYQQPLTQSNLQPYIQTYQQQNIPTCYVATNHGAMTPLYQYPMTNFVSQAQQQPTYYSAPVQHRSNTISSSAMPITCMYLAPPPGHLTVRADDQFKPNNPIILPSEPETTATPDVVSKFQSVHAATTEPSNVPTNETSPVVRSLHGQENCARTDMASKCACKLGKNFTLVCNGVSDCPNNEDEIDCPPMGDSSASVKSKLQAAGFHNTSDEEINVTYLLAVNDDSPTTRLAGDCEPNHKACSDGHCIKSELWCDGDVQCPDGSDEVSCTCRQRIDPVRHCDGFFDCPDGEDELGCHGCPESHFICEDSGSHHHQRVCLPTTKRCDGISDCPNESDERDCSALTETVVPRGTMTVVSHSSGLLHRNIKGFWFPVCTEAREWALEACRAEIAPDVEAEDIEIHLDFVPLFDGELVQPSGAMCLIRNVARVRCPHPKCGSRLIQPGGVSSRPSRSGDKRVVGGKPSKPGAWPFLVALFRDGSFHCGGTLVSTNWVLSAAHCVQSYPLYYYEIQAAMLRRLSFSPMEETRRVTHIVINEMYDRTDMINDLALLRVEPSVSTSRWARLVCLPQAGYRGPTVGTTCTAVGWGATKEHGTDPDQMREVELPIQACKHFEDRKGAELCAGLEEGGKDACQGDSGGPLLCQLPEDDERWYVAGVVSHGEGCARPDEPGAYTRVSLFTDWIQPYIDEMRPLPSKVPLSRCPGLECSRGRCMAVSDLCDKVVNCLDAGDELGCPLLKHNAHTRAEEAKTIARIGLRDVDTKRNNKSKSDSTQPRYFNNERVNAAFKFVQDTGMLSNMTDMVNVAHDLLPQMKGDIRFNDIIKIFNETGLLNETKAINISMFLNPSMPLSVLDNEVANPDDGQLVTNQPSGPFNPTGDGINSRIIPPGVSPESTTVPTLADVRGPPVIPTLENVTVPAAGGRGFPSSINSSPDGKYFHCIAYGQVVPIDRHCDLIRDCEDGSDESNCTCRDYLVQISPSLVCNGELDCADKTDESKCNLCAPGEFYCPLSQQCIPASLVCNQKFDCKYGEDENYCFALTKDLLVPVDLEGRPALRRDGQMSYRRGSKWQPLCISDINQAPGLAADICYYLGFSIYEAFEPLVTTRSQIPEISADGHITEIPSAGKEVGTCTGLYVRCSGRLHTAFKLHSLACTEADYPWLASLYHEGKYTCGATLINKQWLITSASCAQFLDLENHYVAVLLGARRLPGLAGPHEEIRRVSSVNIVEETDVALIQFEQSVLFTRHVHPLMLPNWKDKSTSFVFCMALGPNKMNGNVVAVQFSVIPNCEVGHICLERACPIDENECKVSNISVPWSGVISCQNTKGHWYPAAVFYEPQGACGFINIPPLPLINIKMSAIEHAMAYPLPPAMAPPCDGLRCPLGRCVPRGRLCDGLADCRDRSDEPEECNLLSGYTFCIQHDNPHTCVCGPTELRCMNGHCVPKSRYCDGKDDCGDGTDEPRDCGTCASFLRVVAPARMCDGNRNCLDKSDEFWEDCGCRDGYFQCNTVILQRNNNPVHKSTYCFKITL